LFPDPLFPPPCTGTFVPPLIAPVTIAWYYRVTIVWSGSGSIKERKGREGKGREII